MATAGIGVDMLSIERMERAAARHPRLLARAFTPEERAYCERCARPAEHYAARWAAREAVLKALGCGFADGIALYDVWVDHDEAGRPVARLAGRAAEVAREKGVREVALSISHTHDVAVANALALTDDVRPKATERETAAAALASSFKEARSILDELERVQEGLLGAGASAAPEASGAPAASEPASSEQPPVPSEES